jgi:nitrite reductase (cytochrome c-552)
LLGINIQACFLDVSVRARVGIIQDRNHDLLSRAADATVELINASAAAQGAGMADAGLHAARELQCKSQWRVDFINAENSMGFHAPQEAARILGEAIGFARQGQVDLAKRK